MTRLSRMPQTSNPSSRWLVSQRSLDPSKLGRLTAWPPCFAYAFICVFLGVFVQLRFIGGFHDTLCFGSKGVARTLGLQC